MTLNVSKREAERREAASSSASLPIASSLSPNFHLFLDPPAAGAWNMAVDETLLEAAADLGQSSLRFYQWAEPTLSLGYFQSHADRAEHVASRNCPVVRRASGGGAILHDKEITYSLAVPEKHPLAANRLGTYRLVHETLICTLAKWSVEAKLFSPEAISSWQGSCNQPQAASKEPFLCFERRATGDVIVGCAKIAGSAQRRCRGAVLQHGSVLLAKSAAAPELAGLKELTTSPILAEEFLQAWMETLFAAITAFSPQRGVLTAAQRGRAAELVAAKYASDGWTNAR